MAEEEGNQQAPVNEIKEAVGVQSEETAEALLLSSPASISGSEKRERPKSSNSKDKKPRPSLGVETEEAEEAVVNVDEMAATDDDSENSCGSHVIENIEDGHPQHLLTVNPGKDLVKVMDKFVRQHKHHRSFIKSVTGTASKVKFESSTHPLQYEGELLQPKHLFGIMCASSPDSSPIWEKKWEIYALLTKFGGEEDIIGDFGVGGSLIADSPIHIRVSTSSKIYPVDYPVEPWEFYDIEKTCIPHVIQKTDDDGYTFHRLTVNPKEDLVKVMDGFICKYKDHHYMSILSACGTASKVVFETSTPKVELLQIVDLVGVFFKGNRDSKNCEKKWFMNARLHTIDQEVISSNFGVGSSIIAACHISIYVMTSKKSDYTRVKSSTANENINIASEDVGVVPPLLLSSETVMNYWQAPPPGRWKINSAGSIRNNGHSVGCGGILRDSNGDFVFAYSFRIHACSLIEAKLQGIRLGILFARERGFGSLIVEVDSNEAIKVLQDGRSDDARVDGIVKDIFWGIGENNIDVNWQVVGREINSVADQLAENCHSIKEGFAMYDSVPSFIAHLLPENVSTNQNISSASEDVIAGTDDQTKEQPETDPNNANTN